MLIGQTPEEVLQYLMATQPSALRGAKPIEPQPAPQQSGGPSPMQAWDMYQQFGPGASAAPSAAAPEAAGATGGATGGSGASAAAPLYANPWAWLVAAIAGTSYGLNKNHISSFKDQLTGDMPRDVGDSPNVKHWIDNTFGKDLGGDIQDAVKPYLDAHGIDHLDALPKDVWNSVKAPWHAVANAFKKLF